MGDHEIKIRNREQKIRTWNRDRKSDGFWVEVQSWSWRERENERRLWIEDGWRERRYRRKGAIKIRGRISAVKREGERNLSCGKIW